MRKILFVLCLALNALTVFAAENYILCNREPQITPVLPDFSSAKGCSGSVRLQGIMYLCGKESDAAILPDQFLKKLNEKGKQECRDFCKSRGSQCEGYFEEASKCGFSIPANKTLNFGENMAPCSPSCEGRAFIYCSLYHASYLRVEEKYFKDKKPNCYCRTASK